MEVEKTMKIEFVVDDNKEEMDSNADCYLAATGNVHGEVTLNFSGTIRQLNQLMDALATRLTDALVEKRGLVS